MPTPSASTCLMSPSIVFALRAISFMVSMILARRWVRASMLRIVGIGFGGTDNQLSTVTMVQVDMAW